MLTQTISAFMTSHHKECDEQFAQAEESVANGDWTLGSKQWQAFSAELEKHFTREETILFPEFEEQTGMTGGPTQMMRMEHEQMRALVNEINTASENKDKDHFLALTETLMITMQQHNMKEEQILYPMTDQSLSNAVAIVDKMKRN
ncbi:hemerythrin domain-containing protein [sulfur-oxidizing endosymbiont of Gigantopelta aegis]|uniref:hemerythrin domain-containing protein n=1 Tax=sulfur-oxidizing endosymbiont of Gigantopelta aegis TaxID=2794934 RepID=UPI001FE24D7C|nr:hemerythrin domain-containing protein [sulfur-oxidizing endosymbiont of Gigantopelta aegis]